MGTTDDRNDPALKNIDALGMQEKYLVLSDEERAKQFVRPLRRTYVHVGTPGPRFPLRDLTLEERAQYSGLDYAQYEDYPEDWAALGRFWTSKQLAAVGKGCGHATTMGLAIAETYARQPGFYGGTYCSHCGNHFPVGERGEFVWQGTTERVGT